MADIKPEPTPEPTAKALLAGGCFWCLEVDMAKLDGVTDAVSGYAGGTIPNPTYQTYNKPAQGQTGHIEVVEVTYNPSVVSYAALLDYFLRHIDPTDNGGQFCDRGASYRPAVFVENDAQRATALARLKAAEDILQRPVLVEVLPHATFYAAEEYHQNYASKNPTQYKFYRWKCGRDSTIKDVWKGR